MRFTHFIPFYLLAALAPCAAQADAIPAAYADDPLVLELLGTASARQRLQAEYQQLQSGGGLSEREADDFKGYIADFDTRIAEQCQAVLAKHPDLSTDELPCPNEAPPRAASVIVPPTELPEDAVDSLESELAQGLGDFDEMLLREQEKVANKQARASESGGGAGGGYGGGASADNGEGEGNAGQSGAGKTGQGQKQGKDGKPGGGAKQAGGGSTAGKNTGGSPREEGSRASDDDVVARQLREAAEKETDPELRAKLWEEYRRYKQGN